MSLLTNGESQRCGIFSAKHRLLRRKTCHTAFIAKNFHYPKGICASKGYMRPLQHTVVTMSDDRTGGIFKNKPTTSVGRSCAIPEVRLANVNMKPDKLRKSDQKVSAEKRVENVRSDTVQVRRHKIVNNI